MRDLIESVCPQLDEIFKSVFKPLTESPLLEEAALCVNKYFPGDQVVPGSGMLTVHMLSKEPQGSQETFGGELSTFDPVSLLGGE